MSAAGMAATFRRAAGVIRAGGLAQNAYHDGTAHCTIGALIAAKGVQVYGLESEIGRLVDLLGGLDEHEFDLVGGSDGSTISGFHTVTSWNDAAGRTSADVVGLLEQAAEKLEADL